MFLADSVSQEFRENAVICLYSTMSGKTWNLGVTWQLRARIIWRLIHSHSWDLGSGGSKTRSAKWGAYTLLFHVSVFGCKPRAPKWKLHCLLGYSLGSHLAKIPPCFISQGKHKSSQIYKGRGISFHFFIGEC